MGPHKPLAKILVKNCMIKLLNVICVYQEKPFEILSVPR